MPLLPPPIAYNYILDTRPLWNDYPLNPASRTPITTLAPYALALLPEAEQSKAKAFFFLKDAKLSLASSLLKRYFISRAHGSDGGTWQAIKFGRKGDQKYGKPCYLPRTATNDQAEQRREVDFNTTHQAGLVLLSGFVFDASSLVSVGVDVTCTSERRARDLESLKEEGFEGFVRVHESVFSEADLAAIIDGAEGERPEQQLRRFYAFWALKEAYVKMEGEALLASWLKEVEFRGVRVPSCAAGSGKRWGECVGAIEVWDRGSRRVGVELWLQAFEEDYLVAVAVLGSEDVLRRAPIWEEVDVERDVLPLAETG